MAEFTENLIRFGWLTTEEINQALEEQILAPYNIVYNKSNHVQYLVKEDYTLFEIKSRIPIFLSEDEAIDFINNDKDAFYAGEIISVLIDDIFHAYIVESFGDDTFYIKPIYNESDFSYDELKNIPIKNVGTKISERVNILDLDDGIYKANYFISPSGASIDSLVGNTFYISTTVSGKEIKRITPNSIYDYTVDNNGRAKSRKYATEDFVKSQGYMTDADVDMKLAAMDLVTRDILVDYVTNTCEMLCRHLITMELNSRYGTEQDVRNLFDN